MSNSSAPKQNSNNAPSGAVVEEICRIVSNMCGIQLGERQYSMVESRLKSRIIRLGLKNGDEYLAHLKANSSEAGQLLSLITTHHTYFFREFNHFEFLIKEGLEKIIPEVRKRPKKSFRVWSAACSRGQEVYTIAMFLDFHLKQLAPDLSFEVHGTDVDGESVKVAMNAVYPFQELKSVPSVYLSNNWSRGTGDIAEFAKVKTHLREKCTFGTFNLVKPMTSPDPGMYDVIFCRNVFIYFNDQQIKECARFLMSKTFPHGYLFVGISESLTHLGLDVDYVGPATYARKGSHPKAPVTVESPTGKPSPTLRVVPAATSMPPAAAPKGPLRVFCVDDSVSILSILKKVLSPDKGFEVVGTALNGLEAIEKLKTVKCDLVTLDIHMPEMDGITYLKTAMNSAHPPVVMISTVNRDNSDVAIKALELGAVDYVEKPTLANLEERSEEIRAKLTTAMLFKKTKMSSFDVEFKRNYRVTDPERKAHVVFGNLQHKRKVSFMLKNLEKNSAPLIFMTEGAGATLQNIADEMSKEVSAKVEVGATSLKPGGVYVYDLSVHGAVVHGLLKGKMLSSLAWGVLTPKAKGWLVGLGDQSLTLEDVGDNNKQCYGELIEIARQVTPLTSYYSVAEEYLK